jgi:hypothetical protein
MPVIRSIIKITLRPRRGTSSMRYQQMTMDAGNADEVTVGDTFDLPDIITSIDMEATWQPANCREPYRLTGSSVSFTGGHDS